MAGLLTANNGIGEGARLQLAMLRQLGLSPRGIDLTNSIAADHRCQPSPRPEKVNSSDTGGIAIIHLNPPELPVAIIKAKIARSAYRIGYWAWELESVPERWIEAQNLVNEIWVPSQFCAEAIGPRMSKPTYMLPHPLDLDAFEHSPSAQAHSKEPFTVFFAYDVRSSHARKNPEASIHAFRRGLNGVSQARFLIKVSGLHEYPEAVHSVRRAIAGDPRVNIVTDELKAHEMIALIKKVDAVISLHRAEGFGLLLAQAMLAGKPVVATDWSGNSEFMDSSNSFPVPNVLVPVHDPQKAYCFGRWAEPDIDVAAQHLRTCFENEALRLETGRKAAQCIRNKFGPNLWRRYIERLSALGFDMPRQHAP